MSKGEETDVGLGEGATGLWELVDLLGSLGRKDAGVYQQVVQLPSLRWRRKLQVGVASSSEGLEMYKATDYLLAILRNFTN